jgi:hypothetical protein
MQQEEKNPRVPINDTCRLIFYIYNMGCSYLFINGDGDE